MTAFSQPSGCFLTKQILFSDHYHTLICSFFSIIQFTYRKTETKQATRNERPETTLVIIAGNCKQRKDHPEQERRKESLKILEFNELVFSPFSTHKFVCIAKHSEVERLNLPVL